ncbi:hypothetical protein FKR81_03100 [Lentzea tibetensis]|uniref:DUF6745 domain-containing protein n=1 Tax=Lentzea tibetensis TaxID=2591470 RepID=A0A563F1Z5_9PSEU|nr:hypothetical protein [Lentzea tibetensis]TWP53758.1 hypothetical protein FKR81_03100 [Lentzea tibetensis]
MSARRRRTSRHVADPARALDLWLTAVDIRTEWQGHALRAEPADREAAERAITSLYALAGRPKPRFDWTGSPAIAASLVPPTVNALSADGPWPFESELATLGSALRDRLDHGIRGAPNLWPERGGVRTVLRAQLEPITRRIRSELRDGLGLHWYGQQEADWIAHHDVHRRVLGARHDPEDEAQFELWATVARSCGWWWPREDVCVIAERPSAFGTEPVPGTFDDEIRLHGKAIEFPDGWSVYAWHGTPVPGWVVEAPTVDRIAAERNVEVRRCAIEHIGWAAFIDGASLRLAGQSADPGNPDSALLLYDLPSDVWGVHTRLLLAVNGSFERDGTRRRYGLLVPSHFDNPIDAAGWTYGLSGAQYAQLRRRT